jgi:hypothetical protein
MPDNAGPQRVAAFALIAGFIVCLILVVSLRKKPTIFVIYDVKGSIAAAIEHYPCASARRIRQPPRRCLPRRRAQITGPFACTKGPWPCFEEAAQSRLVRK